MGLPLLALLAALSAPPPAPPGPAAAVSDDEREFRAARLDPTGSGALAFLRDRSSPPPADRLAALTRQLAAADPEARDRAAGALVRSGCAAVPHLRPAANSLEDPAAADRARRCLELIEGRRGARLPAAAVRLAAAARPAGAAGVLLAYLPFADNEDVAREVEDSLAAVARAGGRPDPELLAGLSDASPVRRAAAAAALCRAGGAEGVTAARSALNDPRPAVRLRAALGLAEHHDAAAVPVLIDLLAGGTPERRQEAEEYLARLAGEWALATPKGDDALAARLRREAWLAWWHGVDGDSLLAEFRSRTLTDDEVERAGKLIARLDDGSPEVREKAAAELTEMGGRAVPLLRRATRGSGRVAAAAARCLEDVEPGCPRPLPAAACRLLALRRPAGSLEALLAYLPSADSDEAETAAVDLLPEMGVRDGKADPPLVAALSDRVAARRAAAAEALCRGAAAAELAAVRKLLHDPDPDVRLRSALALAGAREKDAVPALIDLLAGHPRADKADEVEDFLVRLAGEKAPSVPSGTDAADRARARDAWAEWWRAHEAQVDLSRAEPAPRLLGYLLATEVWIAGRGSGRVSELDRGGKVRWEIGNLLGPQEARLLPGDRILVAEQNAGRVTERDPAGRVLWERPVPLAFQCQRLRNGNTFMAGRNLLLEVDRSGREVFSLRRPEYLIAARRLRDGQTALVTKEGNYVRLDAAGKEARSFRLPQMVCINLTAAEVLPGDRVIVSLQYQQKVAEYAGDKLVWEATVTAPGNPTRLPNGHTLVVSGNSTRLTELDRTGKVVGEWKDLPVHPWRVDRR
jgi:HEAT repeat protein